MFRALLAHPQGALYKRHLVYCACARNIPSVVCSAPPEQWRTKENFSGGGGGSTNSVEDTG
jgi:hypothetical protein